MNKALVNESFRKLNEAEELEKDYRQARNKVYGILEDFYEDQVSEFLASPGLYVDPEDIQTLVREYDAKWAKEDYDTQDYNDQFSVADQLVTALVKAQIRRLFYNS
nr:MAG TPA: hypothetical protein [Caudoviricetes sp.]